MLSKSLLALGLLFVAARPLLAFDELAARRDQIEKMTAAEKEDLQEKFKTFLSLPAEEQDQLRRLHEQLESDRQGAKLREVAQATIMNGSKRFRPASGPTCWRLPPVSRVEAHQNAQA